MADLAVEQGSQMASHDAAPEFAQNVFLVVWRDGGDDDPLMLVHRRGKCCQGRKIGRKLEDSADLSTSDCLEFYGPGSKQARPGATDAGGTTKPGLWCITAVFRQWDDGENIEQAISLTRGGPAPKWRRMDRVELAAFARGGVSKKIEAWLLGPTQALWDGSPVVPCETARVAAPETPRLDYSKPPPEYSVEVDSLGIWGWELRNRGSCATPGDEGDARAAAWAHYKAHNDPPGIDVNAWGFGQRGADAPWWRPLFDEAALASARAAAWAWCERRLALREKLNNGVWCPECHSNDAYTEAIDATTCTQPWCTECDVEMGALFDDQWPEMLGWSDDHVTDVERWLADSTAEMPEVLRG